MSETLLSVLREQTRSEHRAIEQQLNLVDPELRLERYVQILERFYGFYAPLDEALKRAESLVPAELQLRRRCEKSLRLDADLRALGRVASEMALCSDLPRASCRLRGKPVDVASEMALCSDLPLHSTPEAVVGCLYVIEGATLGGQVITRHLQEVLHVAPEGGGSFFYGYGSETGAMWRGFQRAVSAMQLNPDDAVHAARATFQRLRSWSSVM